MSTSGLKPAITLLQRYGAHAPLDQLLVQLHLVMERLRFTPEVAEQLADDKKAAETIDFLFKQDVSPEVLAFLHELAEAGHFNVLSGELAEAFLEGCQEAFAGIPELRLRTAVELSSACKKEVAAALEAGGGAPVRVVFELAPGIMGGFVLVTADGATVDYSLRTNLTRFVRQYLTSKPAVAAEVTA